MEDPFEQLLACIERVHASWWAEGPRLYRRELQISDDWGTAVIVQAMVFGNLGARSGTGVMLTRAPDREPHAVEPHGDFVIQGQGDDVVGGAGRDLPDQRAPAALRAGRRARSPWSATSPRSTPRSPMRPGSWCAITG